MWRTATFLLLSALLARADERTQRLTLRLAEEAAAFQRVAPQVIGRETLDQRAQKPPRRFRLRAGKNATRPAEIEWQQRRIESDYAFTTFASDGYLHELRQVTAVDGKPVRNPGPEALARVILATDEGRKRELLDQFEQHGLLGAVTDFGPLLLLFTPANIARYEFTFLRTDQSALVFHYQQLDGPNALTLFDPRETKSLSIAGEVWVREDYLPLRITMDVRSADTRQQATVEYELSRFGALLPVQVDHRESRAAILIAENHFRYTAYQRFAASADIIFEPEEPEK